MERAAGASIDAVPVYIVHWNRPATCEMAVRAFLAQSSGIRVTVLDNRSSREAWQELVQRLSGEPRCTLMKLTENRGYCGGANRAFSHFLSQGKGDWCVVAAHDAVPEPGALERMLAVAGPRIGVIGADQGDGAAGSFHWSRGCRVRPDFARQPDWVIGHCLLIARKFLEEVREEDERIWAYGDEADLCLHGRALGWQVALARGAIVRNVGEKTISRRSTSYLLARNSLLLAEKYAGALPALARAGIILSRAAWWSMRPRPELIGTPSAPGMAVLGVFDWARRRFGPPPPWMLGDQR